MTACKSKDCTHEASFIPRINVPAMHWPIDMHQPLQMFIDLPLCKHHIHEVKIKDFLSDEIKEVFRIMTKGRMPPDFERAYVSQVSVNSNEFKMFRRKQAEREQG